MPVLSCECWNAHIVKRFLRPSFIDKTNYERPLVYWIFFAKCPLLLQAFQCLNYLKIFFRNGLNGKS